MKAIPPSDRFLLASIGIEKGKAFAPDTNTKQLLTEAARVGAAMARTNTFASRDPAAQVYPDRRWEWAFVGGSATWDEQGYVNVDHRAAWNYAATGNSPAMVERTVGSGSQYLMTTRDDTGAFLGGGKNYGFICRQMFRSSSSGRLWSTTLSADPSCRTAKCFRASANTPASP